MRTSGIQQEHLNCLDENTEFEFFVQDGDEVKKGQLMAKVRGDIRTLLVGERTGLNYLQRMSGIATYTTFYSSSYLRIAK